MTKEEIIKIEYQNIINEFANNIALKNDNSTKTLETLKEELSKLGVSLLETSPQDVYSNTVADYFKSIREASKVSPGFGTALEDIHNEIYLSKYVGNIGDIDKTKVTKRTRFDIASITKLFTIIEALKLHEEGLFNVYSLINEIEHSPYKTLSIPVIEALRFKYELQTIGRLDEKGISNPEFYRRLLRPRITQNHYIYSDIPYIIIKTLLPSTKEFFSMYSKELNYKTLSYSTNGIITGSEDLKMVSDGKARRMVEMGLEPGHAGLFGTVNDIIKVLDLLNNGFLSAKSIEMLLDNGTKDYYTPVYDANNNFKEYRAINHGTGVFIEHPEGLNKSQVISGLSTRAFSATGYTGGYSTFDLNNGFATCFLCNPVSIANTEPYHLDNYISPDSLFRDSKGQPYPTHSKLVTEFVNGQKTIHVYDEEGNLIENRAFPPFLNGFKFEQFLTIYKLRFIKKVSLKLAESDLEIEEINKRFSGGKTFKKAN